MSNSANKSATKFSDSDFEIFGLPCQFALDSAALSASYLRLQSQTHPDRFANSSAQEKRLAVQWATRVNEAYKRLQNPMERAIYWCELNGENPRGQQSNLPPALLMQQMEWREALEEIDGVEALGNLLDEVAAEKKTLPWADCATNRQREECAGGQCHRASPAVYRQIHD